MKKNAAVEQWRTDVGRLVLVPGAKPPSPVEFNSMKRLFRGREGKIFKWHPLKGGFRGGLSLSTPLLKLLIILTSFRLLCRP